MNNVTKGKVWGAKGMQTYWFVLQTPRETWCKWKTCKLTLLQESDIIHGCFNDCDPCFTAIDNTLVICAFCLSRQSPCYCTIIILWNTFLLPKNSLFWTIRMVQLSWWQNKSVMDIYLDRNWNSEFQLQFQYWIESQESQPRHLIGKNSLLKGPLWT